MKKFKSEDIDLESNVHLFHNQSSLARKFRRLIDANTNVALLLNEEIKPLSNYSEANNICAKLVVEKLLEECRTEGTQLTELASSHIEVKIRNIAILYENVQDYKQTTNEIATFIEVLLTSSSLSVHDLSKILSKFEIENLPLFAIWKLSTLQVFSFEKVLNKIKGTQKISLLLEDSIRLIFGDINSDGNDSNILKCFISTLIIISYGISHEGYGILQESSNKLLTELPQRILDYVEKNFSEECSDYSQSAASKSFTNIYALMSHVSTIDATALEQFLTNQLITLLTYKPEVPVSNVIKEQEKWRSTRTNKIISKLMFSIIVGIGHILAFNTLDSVVSSLEVNWSHILTYLSTLLLSHPESATKLRGVIDCYLRKGCSTYEIEFLILGFLFARHASQEGRHIFPSYSQWFGAAFGSEYSSPANSKKSFSFLFQFLTTLVPYENPTRLRAHIHQSIYVPKGCQKILRDYQHLARAQIQYLTNKLDLVLDDKGVIDVEQSNKPKVVEEIKCAVQQFEKLGKVPSFVIEASLFKRSYFLNTFLPLLLKPRELPSEPDSKMKLIEDLFQLDKIPKKVYSLYLDECKKMSSSHSGKNETNESNSKSLDTFSNLLERLLSCKIQESSCPGNSSESIVLDLLSQLSNSLEDLTALDDLKIANISLLTINEMDYNSNSLLFQVVEIILDFLQRINKVSESNINPGNLKCSNDLVQLLSLITVSSALQQTLIVTVLYQLKSFENNFSVEKVGFYGRLITALKKIEGMFHFVKTSAINDEQSLKIVDFIIANLPMSTTKQCLLSCFILSASVKSLQYEEKNSNDFQEILSLYACLASRLVAMETEWHLMNITLTSFKRSCNHVIFALNEVPNCCKLFVEGEPPMQQVKLEAWLLFELKTPWGDTPLVNKIRHLQYWFNILLSKVDKNPENYRSKFLLIFWLLLDDNSQSNKNAAEILILLQNFMPTVGHYELSLLEGWKNWKKSNFSLKEVESNNCSYQTKLLGLMSLCRCLPVDKFFMKKNFLQSSSHLRELVLDILGVEGTLYLSFCDTLYLFEALIETVKVSDFTAAQIQQCFHPIKDSVLFHWKSLKFATTVSYESTLERSGTLKYLINFPLDQPQTWKSLPSNDFGTLFLAAICDDDNRTIINYLDAIYIDNNLLSLYKCVSFFGNCKLKCKESVTFPSIVLTDDSCCNSDSDVIMVSDDEDERNKKVPPVKKKQENERILSTCLSLLEQTDLTNPTKVLVTFKTESGQVPIAWKSTLIGLVFILIVMLRDAKFEIQDYQKITSLFSLLLSSFNSLAKLIETEENIGEDVGLSYLSQLNKNIISFVYTLPKPVIALIPINVVNQCDCDVKGAINRLKR